jgi:hypothetical protein
MEDPKTRNRFMKLIIPGSIYYLFVEIKKIKNSSYIYK